MISKKFSALLDYLDGNLNHEEQTELESDLEDSPIDKSAIEGIKLIYQEENLDRKGLESLINGMQQNLMEKIFDEPPKVNSRINYRYLVAASVGLVICCAVFWGINQVRSIQKYSKAKEKENRELNYSNQQKADQIAVLKQENKELKNANRQSIDQFTVLEKEKNELEDIHRQAANQIATLESKRIELSNDYQRVRDTMSSLYLELALKSVDLDEANQLLAIVMNNRRDQEWTQQEEFEPTNVGSAPNELSIETQLDSAHNFLRRASLEAEKILNLETKSLTEQKTFERWRYLFKEVDQTMIELNTLSEKSDELEMLYNSWSELYNLFNRQLPELMTPNPENYKRIDLLEKKTLMLISQLEEIQRDR